MQVNSFKQLTIEQLYAILKLRSDVFISEQQSIYQDIDDLDQFAWHLQITDEGRLAAYARLRAVSKDNCYKIERVVTAQTFRGRGLGKSLMNNALETIKSLGVYKNVYLSAQLEVVDFYQCWGFITKGAAYDDGGILHKDMYLDLTDK